MNVTFVLYTHKPDDDRVWFHQTKSLINYNCNISIISAYSNTMSSDEIITYHSDISNNDQFHRSVSIYHFDHSYLRHNKSLSTIANLLLKTKPDILICDSPIAVIAANRFNRKFKYKAHIIFDVTEWYPSKKNLINTNTITRFAKKNLLSLINRFAGSKTDGFIFGEYFKSLQFRKLYPNKPFIFLPYYPDLSYFSKHTTSKPSDIFNLAYCGNTTVEKGYFTVCNIVKHVAADCPNTKFIFNVIGGDDLSPFNNSSPLPNLTINHNNFLPFKDFCNEICNYDLFFDLRFIDEENNHCLPIKLFYYMACGRPVVFSNLEAISKDVIDYEKLGLFIYENQTEKAIEYVKYLISTINNPDSLFQKISENALFLSKSKYNWDVIKQQFTDFIINFK